MAITNDRIERYEDHQVTFRWRDYAESGRVETRTLDGQDFLRHFVMHVPPKGFVRIRSYGFLANRNRKSNIERSSQLIGQANTSLAVPKREPFEPLRLCPECYAARRGLPARQRQPQYPLTPTLPLSLRPPPNHPVAA